MLLSSGMEKMLSFLVPQFEHRLPSCEKAACEQCAKATKTARAKRAYFFGGIFPKFLVKTIDLGCSGVLFNLFRMPFFLLSFLLFFLPSFPSSFLPAKWAQERQTS